MTHAASVSKQILWILIVFNLTIEGKEKQTKGDPPVVSSSYQRRHVVRAGERLLRLQCLVDSRPHEAILEWQKDGHVIHVGWERFRIRYGTLYVRDLELDDTGVYTCTAVNGFGTAEVRYLVYVSPDVNNTLLPPVDFDENRFQEHHSRGEPPHFIRLDHMIKESHVTQPTGSTVRLRCRASGRPTPEVIWFKDDDKRISDDDDDDDAFQHDDPSVRKWTLRLTKVKVEDSGRYTCRAFNRAGMINFTYEVLIIDYPKQDPVFVTPFPVDVTVTEGDDVTFECHIQSIDVPHVQWLKRLRPRMQSNGNDHSTGTNSSIIFIDDEAFLLLQLHHGSLLTRPVDGHYLTRLIIRRVTSSDAGQYSCSVLTTSGYKHQTVTLSISHSEKSPQDETQSMTALTSVIVIVTLSVITAILFGAIICCRMRRHVKYHHGTPKHCTPLIGSLLPVPPPPPPPPPSSNKTSATSENHYEHHYAALESNPGVRLSGCVYDHVEMDDQEDSARCSLMKRLEASIDSNALGSHRMDSSK